MKITRVEVGAGLAERQAVRILSSLLLLSSLVPMVACIGAESEPDDARDGSFAGKADDFGIREGSPEARGVLQVANELSRTALDEEVGLHSRAAAGIIDFRDGDDGELGTEDDVQIATLAELDGIPYVGPISFDKLLAFARYSGYIPDEELVLSYRFGPVGSQSTFTIYADGRLDHTERPSPGAPAEVKTELLPQAAIGDLRMLITLAAAGPLERSAGAPATLGSESGAFVVYDGDGTEIPIQLIDRDSDGDLYLDVTRNTSIGADELRNLVHAEVEHDMPN